MSETGTAGEVLVGPAGWSYDDWKGIIYPADMPKSRHALSFLCPYFDTVEVNSTFYHPPNPRYCESWVTKVEANPRFLFTVKLWERFTHKREAWPGPKEVALFREGLAPMVEAGKLGAVLVQFPWSFKRAEESRTWLAQVVQTFGDYPLSIEFRHTSWLEDHVFASLAERNIAFCNIDQPIFADSIEPSERVTADFGYVRFHGRNRHAWFDTKATRNDRYNYLYSKEELLPWVERMRRMQEKVKRVFVVTNNHFTGKAIANGLEIQAMLGQEVPPIPKLWSITYPDLGDLPHEP